MSFGRIAMTPQTGHLHEELQLIPSGIVKSNHVGEIHARRRRGGSPATAYEILSYAARSTLRTGCGVTRLASVTGDAIVRDRPDMNSPFLSMQRAAA
ncbi:hypothetical protein C7U92_26590 [Bradyrhizobium sp. WBOS7]|uniref:Transposase n=1 Tax=Bradyrhizobium betae TaxID=244734 RepID=A0AAE9SQK5_9BRAD|nr:hypothetical protein [Bradyrhizobium sp. WBOS2]MDD1573280.1 hypothetical protein [Bradyrhizobium sp. WBOS1]MDD1580265.1 hypothetical protein [Bradyrhizobium sp. WBOS7]MDD1603471.1 hypothetical protein [Bradyrhizobium sp. WBOS16]UUO37678.1 hypothetical protein DCK84_25930 [Bradyrhizobium sp. WBOS01]UUO39919.1 hypothetical protein DCM75_03570 [Bradyrhizobium sp. WBOS02]UUO57131.1 hypothetical protein DCM79_31795 [Bradyrhizobium sp. WBOS07]UUO67125.1 hypothetical protein DCM83_19260 [Bradyrh